MYNQFVDYKSPGNHEVMVKMNFNKFYFRICPNMRKRAKGMMENQNITQ
jgi:hypothetical protein